MKKNFNQHTYLGLKEAMFPRMLVPTMALQLFPAIIINNSNRSGDGRQQGSNLGLDGEGRGTNRDGYTET
jgi:hypothetical protein